MPVRHRADFKQALSTLRHLTTKRIQLIIKNGKALPHLGGTGKNPGGILHLSITATMDPALIDQGNLMDSDWANYSSMILRINLVQNYSSKFGNSQTAVYRHRRGCKHKPPIQQNPT